MNGEQREPLKHFSQLIVWQEAKDLLILIYNTTEEFPGHEKFVLSSQMRRAALSITSNIAEGFGRKTAKDKEHFYVMAAGSLTELENQVLIASSLGYIKIEQPILQKITGVSQLLNGLLRTHRQQS